LISNGLSLLFDSIETKVHSRLLFQASLIKCWTNSKPFKVHILALEQSKSVYLSLFSQKNRGCKETQITIFDAYSDPIGWIQEEKQYPQIDGLYFVQYNRNLSELTNKLKSIIGGSSTTNSIIVIDSLSTLFFRNSQPQVFELLHMLNSNKLNCMAVIHKDIHKDSVIQSFEYFATNILTVTPSLPYLLSIQVGHKRKGGKFSQTEENYKIEREELILVEKQSFKTSQVSEKAKEDGELTTFKLSLTDDEKAARQSVVLPYTHHLKEDKPTQGSVIYIDEDDVNELDDDLDL